MALELLRAGWTRVGSGQVDFVDFGWDGKMSNGPSIDLMGEPWHGAIVKLEGLDAIVDTGLNSLQRYAIEELKFLGRQPVEAKP